MSDKRRELEQLRHELGHIDAQILAAVEQRIKVSKKIGDWRRVNQLQTAYSESSPTSDLLARAASADVPVEALRRIFQEIVATCIPLEEPTTVAFAGREGSSVHAIARSRFGVGSQYLACESAAAALEEVTRRRASYAVVAYETQSDGLVQGTLAALSASDLKIMACFETGCELALASTSPSPGEIKTVYATSSDRAASERFLASKLPAIPVVEVTTVGVACEKAAGEAGAAAVAETAILAETGLRTVFANVRDAGDERVRYAIVGTRPSGRSGKDLTAIVFAVNDSPGALHEVLKQFAERGVNLTKVHSRPSPGEPWGYVFFLEAEGHATDRAMVGALEEVRRRAKFFKVLGSYTTSS